jgi:hypothetical protein
MTLTVDVNPLALKGNEREFFFKVVDVLNEYEQSGSSGSAA